MPDRRRWMIGIAAALWVMGWGFVGLPWRSASASPSLDRVRLVPFEDGRPMSQALNVVAFVPCGALAIGLGWPVPAAIGVGAGISLTTEVLQLFSRRRYPSITDLMLNTAGTALGALMVARRLRRAQP